MENPFNFIGDQLDKLRVDVTRAVHVAVLKEIVSSLIARLAVLQPEKDYGAVLEALERV